LKIHRGRIIKENPHGKIGEELLLKEFLFRMENPHLSLYPRPSRFPLQINRSLFQGRFEETLRVSFVLFKDP